MHTSHSIISSTAEFRYEPYRGGPTRTMILGTDSGLGASATELRPPWAPKRVYSIYVPVTLVNRKTQLQPTCSLASIRSTLSAATRKWACIARMINPNAHERSLTIMLRRDLRLNSTKGCVVICHSRSKLIDYCEEVRGRLSWLLTALRLTDLLPHRAASLPFFYVNLWGASWICGGAYLMRIA